MLKSVPLPSPIQDVPFHDAILLTRTPPISEKPPAAINSGSAPPAPSASYSAKSPIAESTPPPNAAHVSPSHCARFRTVTPPARLNNPPTSRIGSSGPLASGSKTNSAVTVPFVPPLTSCQAEPFQRAMSTSLPFESVKKPPAYNSGGFGPSASLSNTASDVTVSSLKKPSPLPT